MADRPFPPIVPNIPSLLPPVGVLDGVSLQFQCDLIQSSSEPVYGSVALVSRLRSQQLIRPGLNLISARSEDPLLSPVRTVCVLASVPNVYPPLSGRFPQVLPPLPAASQEKQASLYRSTLHVLACPPAFNLSHESKLFSFKKLIGFVKTLNLAQAYYTKTPVKSLEVTCLRLIIFFRYQIHSTKHPPRIKLLEFTLFKRAIRYSAFRA